MATAKMSKSLGNHIATAFYTEDMYGKVMSVPDKAMGLFMRLVTRWTPPVIAEIETGLKEGRLHPRMLKMKMYRRREIVEIYHVPRQLPRQKRPLCASSSKRSA